MFTGSPKKKFARGLSLNDFMALGGGGPARGGQ